MNFSVKLTAWTYLLGGAVSWDAWYYDSATGNFVDGGWHLINEAIPFNNVSPGGYVAVALYDGITRAPLDGFLYSSAFSAQDGDIWTFWLSRHGQSDDMTLVTTPAGWTQVAISSLSIAILQATEGWRNVAISSLSIAILQATEGWRNVATKNLTITIPHPPVPPEGGGVPWVPIAIGAGAAVAIAAVIAGSKAKPKK